MIETGTLLHDRFLVEAQIGVGGMGAVYRAIDQKFGSIVAIKETFFNDEELAEAFEREARLLNGLHHPIFPHVSDHFIENDGHFLVMEYIEGEDLSDLIKQGERFDLDTVTKWTFDLLDGLDYLHSQDPPIIHRDIKPSNLKLTSRGNIVLLDFGMAKETSGNTLGMRSVFGYSRRYSPLEQIEGTGTDFRSDIFSLGATIFHLLTGTPPVDVLKRASAIVARRSDPLALASDINPDVPERVAVVINSALALNLEDRFVSARAMWNALQHALTGEQPQDVAPAVIPITADTPAEPASAKGFPALEAFEAEVQADGSDSPAVSAFRSVTGDDYDPIAALVAQRVSQMKAADAGSSEVYDGGSETNVEGDRIMVPVFDAEEPAKTDLQDFELVEGRHVDANDRKSSIVETEHLPTVAVLGAKATEYSDTQDLGSVDTGVADESSRPPVAVAQQRLRGERYNYPALIGIPLLLLVLGISGYALLGTSTVAETAEDAPVHQSEEAGHDPAESQTLRDESTASVSPDTATESLPEDDSGEHSMPHNALNEETPATRASKTLEASSLPVRSSSDPPPTREARRDEPSGVRKEPVTSATTSRPTRPRIAPDEAPESPPVSSIESIMTGIPTDRSRRTHQRQWEVWEEDQLRRERRQRRIDRRNRQNWPPF